MMTVDWIIADYWISVLCKCDISENGNLMFWRNNKGSCNHWRLILLGAEPSESAGVREVTSDLQGSPDGFFPLVMFVVSIQSAKRTISPTGLVHFGWQSDTFDGNYNKTSMSSKSWTSNSSWRVWHWSNASLLLPHCVMFESSRGSDLIISSSIFWTCHRNPAFVKPRQPSYLNLN